MKQIVRQITFNFIRNAAGAVQSYLRRRRRGCYRRAWGCLGLIILLTLLACALFSLTIYSVSAEEPPEALQTVEAATSVDPYPLAIHLVIDNSASMYTMGGVGTDPNFLRIDAARLFISYLGVDDSRFVHRCGVIFFGTEAHIVVPLTELLDETRRAEMFALIQEPPNMGWTDQAAALALARADLEQQTAARPAIVLLTDGKPEWKAQPTAVEQEAYMARLKAEGERLAAAGIPLFIILLANEATDADPDIAAIWQPAWQRLAAMTSPGQFYIVREATDLAGVYHDIVLTLTGNLSAGVVVDQVAGPSGAQETISVEPDLARLTLVISKSRPDLTVAILQPDQTIVTDRLPNVRFAGQPGVTNEEIWVIDEPAAGQWTVQINGEGRVIVWKDYHPQPAATAPPPLPTAAPTPTPTPTPAATAAPEPSLTPTTAPITAPTPWPAPVIESDKPAKSRPSHIAGHSIGVYDRNPLRPWLIGLLFLGGLSGIAGYRYWQGARPLVEGELRHVSGPGFSDGQRAIELEALSQPRVTVGAPPAQIPLPVVTDVFTLRPGRLVGDCYEMLISGPTTVELNDQPLPSEQPLADGDRIKIGETQLRYENLRLRSATRALL